jgi:endonuclease/exonuclease/phosphatase family metal-dependent hydrolase
MKKAKSGIFRFGVKMLILAINIFFILLLLLTYLAPFINPESAFIPAMLGLFYPMLLIINILFAVFWLLRFKYFFLFSLVTMLLGWGILTRNISFSSKPPVQDPGSSFKFLSYNVRLFDQFKWIEGQDYFTRDAIFSFISQESPDIVSFQEFFHGSSDYFPTIPPFLQLQKANHYHVDYVKEVAGKKHYGLATFSRFPIINKGKILFPNSTSNSGIYSDIVIDRDTVRVFNVHLESIRLSVNDYKFVTEFIDPGMQPQSSSSSIILGKFRRAFEKRADQATIVAEYIEQSPYPVIVSGDFNDTPISHVYHKISSGLKDAFLESGFGFGSTYSGSIPFIRIDYILHSERLYASGFQKHKVQYSDHFPVSCYFSIDQQAGKDH